MTASRVKISFWLEREQREALKRAVEKNTMKPDASAIVREAVAAWFASPHATATTPRDGRRSDR